MHLLKIPIEGVMKLDYYGFKGEYYFINAEREELPLRLDITSDTRAELLIDAIGL